MYFGCLNFYFGCLNFYFGCLNLYFGYLDLYCGCLDLYFGCSADGRDGRAGGRPGRESSKHGEKSILGICTPFCIFPRKTRAKVSRILASCTRRDLSYETDSGPKTKTVSDLNFQVTPTTATTARRQLSHLARPLDHHAQGPNIPFGVNPSLRQ